jgi:hypothetical protein
MADAFARRNEDGGVRPSSARSTPTCLSDRPSSRRSNGPPNNNNNTFLHIFPVEVSDPFQDVHRVPFPFAATNPQLLWVAVPEHVGTTTTGKTEAPVKQGKY